MGRSTQDARTISIETGIQNSGLALILIFNFFNGNGGMALIAAGGVYGIWFLPCAGFVLEKAPCSSKPMRVSKVNTNLKNNQAKMGCLYQIKY